jgi:hypothetical protein
MCKHGCCFLLASLGSDLTEDPALLQLLLKHSASLSSFNALIALFTLSVFLALFDGYFIGCNYFTTVQLIILNDIFNFSLLIGFMVGLASGEFLP